MDTTDLRRSCHLRECGAVREVALYLFRSAKDRSERLARVLCFVEGS
jgi:hypothetical protein